MPRTRKPAVDKKRAAAWKKLWQDPRYLRLQARKDAALKKWSRAEDTWRVTHLPIDKARADAADRSLRRYLRAQQKFEDAWLRRFA